METCATPTAIAIAEEMFRRHVKDRPFVSDLALYLRHGFLINWPGLFVMGRPVHTEAPIDRINDPRWQFDQPNAWFVCMASGRLDELARVLPYPLPFICFYRKFRSELKVYRTEELLSRCRA